MTQVRTFLFLKDLAATLWNLWHLLCILCLKKVKLATCISRPSTPDAIQRQQPSSSSMVSVEADRPLPLAFAPGSARTVQQINKSI